MDDAEGPGGDQVGDAADHPGGLPRAVASAPKRGPEGDEGGRVVPDGIPPGDPSLHGPRLDRLHFSPFR